MSAGRERADVRDDGGRCLHPQVHPRHVPQPHVVGGDHKEATQPRGDLWPHVPRHCSEEDILPTGIHGGAPLLSAQATDQSGATNCRESKRHDL